MPSAAARRIYEDQIPSFMSVFDLDAETIAAQETVTLVDPKFIEMEATGKPLANPVQHLGPTMPSDPMHKHHDSTSTQASESAESSPTTTLSTSDSSPLSDPSPSSSPDSPVNLIPLSSFPATSFGGLSPMSSMNTLTAAETTSFGRPMTSPSPRRPKNMKGLSIQPPFVSNTAATLVSEPASPSFIKPTIPAMKRKPSQLSLNTKTSDLVMRNTLEVPSTPGLAPILQRRALKHSTSSPHMLPSLKSATFGPSGGMTFPKVLERNESGLSELLRPTKTGIGASFDTTIVEEESPIRTQLASRAALDFEPYHEHENNEDQKTPGYPDGPIAIYEDNVYLYLEPTAEEASKFDTVINVAREVNNPFSFLPKSDEKMSDSPAALSPIPDTALSNASFSTAFEFPTIEEKVETPTTPKATSSSSMKRPEYIHMPWDHNTDIAQDLMHLCETIDARTKEGKKVLVHCQQGASRSASLIIAYGLYRNPDLSVNDAYYAAQGKSRWISPNMKLMYCLQDFQKQVSKKKASPGSAFRPRAGRSPTKHRLTLSADATMGIAPKEPLTAPLPGEKEGSSGYASPEKGSPTRARGHSTPGSQPISPGPSSAPSSFSCSESGSNSAKIGNFDVDRLLPQPKPVLPGMGFASSSSFFAKPPLSPGFSAHRFGPSAGFGFSNLNLGPSIEREAAETIPKERHVTLVNALPDDAALLSPRAETMTKNPLHDTRNEFPGMRFIEVPPTPSEGLFSPRETMFPRDPFYPFGRPTQVADPRSPPTKGETPIVRSIDELL
ncbi:Tyrosine-protein phosphatase pmp1 [Colletotrichum chlorophyti]|uniref:protein-tyrosine-phosphatase n=1 Tax=Colletotrichum chlorophyti TaxID=708187 RepID=A0A1Q8S0E1_9PEZI|nr:Tyrosine-protein phosphatase pmp1 [Colletotrichum chlorophyti]